MVAPATRTPFGRFGGSLAGIRPDDLGAHIVREIVGGAAGLAGEHIDEVINRLCGSSLHDAGLAARQPGHARRVDRVARRGDRAAPGETRHHARAAGPVCRALPPLADQARSDSCYDDLTVPVPGVELARDESIRPDTTVERLAGLRTPFRKEGGMVTAGYAPVDAASLALERAGITWSDVAAVELKRGRRRPVARVPRRVAGRP